MDLNELKTGLREVKSLALSELRSAVSGDFKFWMGSQFYFYDEEANRYVNFLASGGGRHEEMVYFYGRDQDSDQKLAIVLDEWFDVEELVALLNAYRRRDEPPEELKGLPELPDDVGSLIASLVGEDVAYYLKIALNERERVLGPFSRTTPPPLKISQLHGYRLWYRRACEEGWNEIGMHF